MHNSPIVRKPVTALRGAAGNHFVTLPINLRRSATEAQLGLEFGGVSKIEFEFEFLFRPWLKFTFELECEFDFGVKSEFPVEVVPENGVRVRVPVSTRAQVF